MTDKPEEPRTPPEGLLRASEWFGLATPGKDDAVHEVELTAKQATDLLQGRALTFTSPEVPDIVVDDDGTLTERDDARPGSKE
jgi:hypothetical protein